LKAKNEAQRAVALDPNLAAGHAILGVVHADYDWDWPGAEREERSAIALNPSSPMPHHDLAWVMEYQGRWQEAIDEFSSCIALDPLLGIHYAHLGQALAHIRRESESEQRFREALELAPNSPGIQTTIGLTRFEQHRYREAITAFQRGGALFGEQPMGHLAFAYIADGDREKGLEILGQLEHPAPPRPVDAYEIAVIYTALGNHDRALQYLERSDRDRSESFPGIITDPAFDSLRSDSCWQGLVRRLELKPSL